MDGATLRAGGVGCVERVRNPISLARKILEESPHTYFVGEGAERFAQKHGIALCRNEDLVLPREVERLRKVRKHTGVAELFAVSHDTVGAVALDERGTAPQEAARMAVDRQEQRLQGRAGLMLLDPSGRFGLAHNTPRMAWAYRSDARQASGIQCE